MDDETKLKIKTIMTDHLKSVGWPDCSDPDQVVMQNLQPMFNLLLKANLVKYDDYDKYLLAAQFQYMMKV